jgi:hypothetical protein
VQAGRWFKNSVTGQRTIRGFDLSILDDNNQILLIRILEQNPDTMTPQGTLKPLANAARQGSKICWIIDRRKKTGGWLGRVQDGQYIAPEPRATYPATYEPNTTYPANATPQPTPPPVTYETSVPEPVYDTLNPNVLDDIPTDLDIPDIVLQHFAEDDYVD